MEVEENGTNFTAFSSFEKKIKVKRLKVQKRLFCKESQRKYFHSSKGKPQKHYRLP